VNYEVTEKKGATVRIGLTEIEDGRYQLQIDGQKIEVDVARSGRTIYSIIEDGHQFEAVVDEKGAHGFDVLVAGRLFHLEALDERTRLLASQAAHVPTGPQTVAAEMPGKVVKVHLRPGDAVHEGQGVVVVEAMKMENEIASPIEGVVREIAVAEGHTVEAGAPLFTVDPRPAG
jgi:biotin carboxyl carrier protein